ncbi:Tata-box binding protein, partial [Operophtera brumata]
MATLIQENGIKELSKGGHGITSHMVPDHEYCEAGAGPAPAPAMEVAPQEEEDTPEIDIMINNVVCSFSVKCHLNLRQIALKGVNVEFRRENGMVTMKLRRPYTTASIWSSGRITCTGATSEDQSKIAARRYARALQKLGFQVRFQNFRVVNVLGTCRMPFGIRIISFSKKYKEADFSVKCHLNLRQIALKGVNVEFRRENGMVTMKLRRPYTTASIWSSGRITCTGATSEDQSKIAARRYARALQKLGFQVRFQNFRVVNVLGTCRMPFGIRIISFSKKYKEADYEPELHPGVTYKLYNPKATLKIFSTGGVTITARSVNDVQSAVERIFPLCRAARARRIEAPALPAPPRPARDATRTLELFTMLGLVCRLPL